MNFTTTDILNNTILGIPKEEPDKQIEEKKLEKY